MLAFTTGLTAVEVSFAVASVIFGDVTFTSVLYLGIISGNVAPGFSGRNIALAALI